jgi:tetratricopeptide (TPR) repeat protein
MFELIGIVITLGGIVQAVRYHRKDKSSQLKLMSMIENHIKTNSRDINKCIELIESNGGILKTENKVHCQQDTKQKNDKFVLVENYDDFYLRKIRNFPKLDVNSKVITNGSITQDLDEDNLYFEISKKMIVKGKIKAAIDIMEEALLENPNNWKIINNLGVYYIRNGKYTEALDILLRVDEQSSDIVQYNLGVAHYMLGEFSQAIKCFSFALQSDYLSQKSIIAIIECSEQMEVYR